MSLYWQVNLLAISVPFLVSFHPRLKLYKHWPSLFLSIFLTLIPFVIWDVWFTESGYWGFNPDYLSGQYLFSLPLEEWFFFIAIPYACIFTHFALITLWPNISLSDRTVRIMTPFLLTAMGMAGFYFHSKWYTLLDMIFGFVVLVFSFYVVPRLLKQFYLTFLVMLIPFFLVNGILTGTGIESEVVWYDNAQNLGIRLGTIPIEDVVYAFSLILLNLLLFEMFRKEKIGA